MFGLFKKKSQLDIALEDIGKCGDILIKVSKKPDGLRALENVAAITSVIAAIGKRYTAFRLGSDGAFALALRFVEQQEFGQLDQLMAEMAEHLSGLKGYVSRGQRIAEWYVGPGAFNKSK